MSVAKHHAEWLSLIEVSGPFFSLPVLLKVFPQGLPDLAPEDRARLRAAYDEWRADGADPAIHRAWLDFLLREGLGYAQSDLAEGQGLPPGLAVPVAEHGETLRPALALLDPTGRGDTRRPRLLIEVVPPGQGLEKPLSGRRWKASPATRMMALCHGAGVPLGLLTNGEHLMLVHARPGETTTYASFYAGLFFEEPLTLRAFTAFLGLHRFFGVPDDQTTEALLAESAVDQQEVTDQLGRQVRRAVEVLIQTLDRLDRDSGRALLRDQSERRLYEAAVTVMMRLVFLFAAEERGLLLLGDEVYDAAYAVSTLREQLQQVADAGGEELLERRTDAWSRLLATFRAVHGGVRHEAMRLPAYGGSLFDPDRFPFLEGRRPGTSWRDTKAAPLAIDDRTVLHLLSALQLLEVKVPGGRETRRLSFRALDVEQIGHVYEGLLDHTAVRAKAPVVSLKGGKGLEPEIGIEALEAAAARGEDALLAWLKETTGRSPSALKKALTYEIPADAAPRWMRVCEGDAPLYGRLAPFAGLVREDTHGDPVVYEAGAVYVTDGLERRATGTHYTPRSLTEPVVRHTLEPLVYEGPAEGAPPERWRLKGPADLLRLRVCDLAMGSGAFLVQACRYLSERLVEAWEAAEQDAGGRVVVTPEGALSRGDPGERPLPRDPDERLALARRVVADRCLFGVDVNPMAVEMAKLSLWLVTLQKDRPFTFVNHALRSGDSLLGLIDEQQVRRFHLDPEAGRRVHATLMDWTRDIGPSLERATALRQRLESFTVEQVRDAEEKARLLAEAEALTADLRLVADLVVAAALSTATKRGKDLDGLLRELSQEVAVLLGHEDAGKRATERRILEERRDALLNAGRGEGQPERRPFHWVLEFPEVVREKGGFDAFVGNPPFQGGQRITGALGTDYRQHLVEHLAGGARGSADLCAYFFLRAGALLRDGGGLGLLATNTIAQGDTREVGLDRLVEGGFSIPRATQSKPWPGEANLEVAEVWLRKGGWQSGHVLDGKAATGITANLTRPGKVLGKPYRLAANAGKSFIGSYVLGMGFVLTPEEAQALIDRDPRNRDVLFPYLNGQDLNSRWDQSPSRWVINFQDWPLDRGSAPAGYAGPVAADYPDCLAIVEAKVRPERMKNNRKVYRDRWWQYAEKRPALADAISGMGRVLPVSSLAKHHAFAFIPERTVFDHNLVVIAFHEVVEFTVLQSSIHVGWATHYSSGLETRLGYRPSDGFDTFPFPENLESLSDAGYRYEAHRRDMMHARGEGLTRTYNRFHDPKETAVDVCTLRDLHVEVDRTVTRSYGWDDLDLRHDFHETKQGVRFTLSESARREVLDRLLALNHARYAEEVRQGLHGREGKKRAATAPKRPATPPRPKTPARQPTFDFAVQPPRPDRTRTSPRPTSRGPASAESAPLPGLTDPDLDLDARKVLLVLSVAAHPMTRQEIVAATDVPERGCVKAIKILKAAEYVRQESGRGVARYCVRGNW